MITCKEYVKKQKEQIATQVKNTQRPPALAIVQVGNHQASNAYVKGKLKDCNEVGIEYYHAQLEENCTEQELLNLIDSLNEDKCVDGIIVQLPLPKHLQKGLKRIQQRINVFKDVDGFRKDSEFKPCTPKGIIDWISFNDYDLQGKNVTIIGRSDIVGKPLVNMLLDKNATVTCCHSFTKSIRDFTFNSDVVISAIGQSQYWTWKDFSKDTDLIIDVGINRTYGNKLCGDVDTNLFDVHLPNVYTTPVPGGVGLLTRVALLENVLHAYYINGGK